MVLSLYDNVSHSKENRPSRTSRAKKRKRAFFSNSLKLMCALVEFEPCVDEISGNESNDKYPSCDKKRILSTQLGGTRSDRARTGLQYFARNFDGEE